VDRSFLIEVRVTGVSALREIIGEDTVVILKSGSTVRDLINKLDEEFGSEYKKMVGEELGYSIKKRFNLLINDVVTTPAPNFEKGLNDGDRIVIFQLAGA
jgi:molybdopterin converting factor small subunit